MVMLSMTGFGEAQQQDDELTVRVEIRSVNNRHLKLSCRVPEGYASVEPQLEAVVRELTRRGALQLNLQIERVSCAEDYQLNETVLVHYYRQIAALHAKLQDVAQIHLAELLQLPGVISEVPTVAADVQHQWPLIEATLRLALKRLNHMRQLEGNALAADLRANCESIEKELDQIEQLAPEVVKSYESRMRERIGQLLTEHSLPIDQAPL
jgi:uncharacterized protein (TIGR00255 family)